MSGIEWFKWAPNRLYTQEDEFICHEEYSCIMHFVALEGENNPVDVTQIGLEP